MIGAARLRLQRGLRIGLTLHWGRFVRFSIVGASGVLVNSTVLFALVQWARLSPVPAAAVATECAIVTNFLLNDRWTFGNLRLASSRWPRRFASYNVLTLGGLCIDVVVVAALHGLAGVHYLLANLVGIGAAVLWNYGSNLCWTWTRAARI